ncbi:MAG: hypothetical protein AAB225_10855 [Acidobacteriota bacterium]
MGLRRRPGTQSRSNPAMHEGMENLRAGVIGGVYPTRGRDNVVGVIFYGSEGYMVMPGHQQLVEPAELGTVPYVPGFRREA